MSKKINHKLIAILVIFITLTPLTASSHTPETQIYRVRLFFGLSLPEGGSVSFHDWQYFLQKHIATTFDGFNVVDSLGFYKGKPERSKVITLIVMKQEMPKIEALARLYAQKFHQDSVMMVSVPVLDWRFISKE